jgi:hypothetical protein
MRSPASGLFLDAGDDAAGDVPIGSFSAVAKAVESAIQLQE